MFDNCFVFVGNILFTNDNETAATTGTNKNNNINQLANIQQQLQ